MAQISYCGMDPADYRTSFEEVYLWTHETGTASVVVSHGEVFVRQLTGKAPDAVEVFWLLAHFYLPEWEESNREKRHYDTEHPRRQPLTWEVRTGQAGCQDWRLKRIRKDGFTDCWPLASFHVSSENKLNEDLCLNGLGFWWLKALSDWIPDIDIEKDQSWPLLKEKWVAPSARSHAAKRLIRLVGESDEARERRIEEAYPPQPIQDDDYGDVAWDDEL